ncbi:hypothetical protein OROHE_008368 [Orobanche hederae]
MMHFKTINNIVPPSQPPPGLILFGTPERSHKFHQFLVLLLTFTAYAAFHASRKPPSIVKSILTTPINQILVNNATTKAAAASDSEQDQSKSTQNSFHENEPGWAPFDGPRGPHRLGELDLSFLLAYAIVVFCGLFQSIGWPCVVAVVGNWFGKSKRGLIMGIWNSQTSVGNIIGSIIASSVLGFGWGWSFILPGSLIILIAVLIYFFLAVHPENIGFELSGRDAEMNVEGVALVETVNGGMMDSVYKESSVAIGFLDAWRLPHVTSYAFCLFFSKLVAYTFLYWLPFYIRHTAVAGVHLSHKTAGILSTIFDVGGVFGGISAGLVSDMIGARAVTSVVFLLLSIPTLILYSLYGSMSMLTNTSLMFVSGLLVNGPYSLITTAVAADLGSQSMIGGNSRALATVTAIIDGTGSVGAALGPLLAGYISTRGWNSVFFMLIVSILFAGCLLIRVVNNEIKGKLNEGKWLWLSVIARLWTPPWY